MGDNKERSRRIYTTELINQLITDRSQGYDIDYSPFFERDLQLRAPNVTFKMTDWEYNEYLKCYNDPLYFISNYCKFKVDGGYELVKLRDYQEEMIKLLTDEKYDEELGNFVPANRNVIICSARQSGKTTTLCSIIAHKLSFNSAYNTLLVANSEKTALEIVSKVTEIFKNLPYFLKPGCVNFGKTQIRLDNGSQIFSSATTNTASIGFTINFVLLDEFAHIPDNIVNNFWRSIYPTLSSSKIAQCAIISTPNGTANKYYEIWQGSLNGTNSFKNMKIEYYRVPGHDEAWAEQMKRDFGEEEFAQEFELQFNKNSKMLLKTNDMRFLERVTTDYVNKYITINNQYLNDEHLTWHPDFDPNNINENDIFVFLIDISEGNGDVDEMKQLKEKTPDANTIQIFKVIPNSPANIKRYSNLSCKIKDCVKFVQVGKYKNSSEDEIQAARVCAALSYNLFKSHERNNVKVMIEMNFNGKSFFEEFKRHPYYSDATVLKTYHKKPIPGEKQTRKFGFKTTSNKEYYCIKGNKMINMRRVVVTCKDTFNQMLSFGYVRGKLKGIACHDDLSMPVFNHIPRMLDENSFVSWIEEYLYLKADRSKVYVINDLIQKWAMDNPEMSDSDFTSLYFDDENASQSEPIDFMPVTYGQAYAMENNVYGGMSNQYGLGLTYSSLLNR